MLQGIVKKGKVIASKVPTPKVTDNGVLIKVHYSCISAGTEMTSVNTSKKSLIKRALDQPDEVRTAIDFAKTNGILKTIQRVRGVLDNGKQTGYSISGEIVAIGNNIKNFQIGDRVAAAGAGLANHAEFVDVPENLVMKMPKTLSYKSASTVTLGGIAMQGVRRAEMNLGETCVVVGAGILGLLSLQMLKRSGVQVIVSDLDEKRLKLAKDLGADLVLNPTKDDVVSNVNNFSGGIGADAVLFTAATSSNKPLSDSFKMCRKKGKVVLVGVVGMEINRADMYAKELDFLISTSYGPGRYDSNYEDKGIDYPIAYVRWTENRNMTEFLRLLDKKLVTVDSLIDAEFPISEIDKAFDSLNNIDKPIITLLNYENGDINVIDDSKIILKTKTTNKDIIQVGLIGAGAFATSMHLPHLKSMSDKFNIKAIMSRTGFKAKTVSDQFSAEYSTTDIEKIINDPEIDLVIISTRHDSHGELVLKCLEAGKHTFVEKPLTINKEELEKIEAYYQNGINEKPILMTGFNRRFSKYSTEIRKHTSKRINPLLINYRMNAGFIPLDHWVHDDGGRIIGEACHIIDLMTSFTNSKIVSFSFEKMNPNNEKYSPNDNVSMVLKYEDGSVCNIQYFANGSKKISKEYMEIHFDGKSIVMDDYKTLKGFDIRLKEINERISNKGQKEELVYLHDSIKGISKTWPIELWDMIQTTELTFEM